jgi:hypothetical protein
MDTRLPRKTWETLHCFNANCDFYRIPMRHGRLVKNGTSYGQPFALCKHYGSSVALNYATSYYLRY